MPLTLYRLTKEPQASLDDFRSNMERCLAPRPAEVRDPGEWAGLSMFDTREQAEYTARRYADRGMGQFVAEVVLPDGAPQVIRAVSRPTGGHGHYTVWGCAERLLAFVVDVQAVRR
jgi:hypothetical protein